ncbi:MAG: DUF2130 domain-containing protein [Candidatus Levyibacteriota bacterium]|nr:MAG: DUF2130 domain-containing protein [Candidatus Levybacteria bacterium]
MNQIICPHCKKSFEITQAIAHEIEEKILQEERIKFNKELEKVKLESQEQAAKKLQEQFAMQLKQIKEDSQEKDQRIKELLEQVTNITRDLRQTKREKEEAGLEMQKKLAEEEDKIRLDARKKVEEEQMLKMREKDKQIQDAMKEVEEMKSKLQQGSQQMQGEVFELHFQEILEKEFPNDKIAEVAKGVRGGDIVQEVWDRNGNICGTILWELKNSKTWREEWINKLKTDQRAMKADYAVITTDIAPSEVDTAKYYKNLWVTKRNFAISLAYALRLNLIQIAMAKRASEGQKEKKDVLYTYVSSTEFRLRIEAIVEAFTNMQTEIEKEKRYFSNKWARDEKNIRQVIDNTYGMHGDLKGILGNLLPQIKGLEALELGDGKEK